MIFNRELGFTGQTVRPMRAWEARRITPRVRQVVALHLNCHSHIEIAHICGITPIRVSQILNSARVKEMLAVVNATYDQEISALLVGALQATRRGLGSTDPNTYLRAAEQVYKVNGKYMKGAPVPAETAEDVISRALHAIREEAPDGTSRTEVKLLERREVGGD